MGRVPQDSEGKGSLKDIQVLVNKHQKHVDKLLKSVITDLTGQEIIWTSPIAQDCYAEYRDDDFLLKVGLDPKNINLEKFWPARGPQWDALARTTNGQIILVEAKANISEIASQIRAKGMSKERISHSLNETKKYLNINNLNDWSLKYYQYANRLAHLYYLREKCKVSAYLVNIYFFGDKSVKGPQNEKKWQKPLHKMHEYLGLSHHKLSQYIADIFIDTGLF